MLPNDAPMPPCAATVCERVGKTLLSTATFRPAKDSCSDARMPEPPAPTMTTSNLRWGSLLAILFSVSRSNLPQHLDAPPDAADQPDDRRHLQQQPHADRLDVVHPDVAHADPDVPTQRDE